MADKVLNIIFRGRDMLSKEVGGMTNAFARFQKQIMSVRGVVASVLAGAGMRSVLSAYGEQQKAESGVMQALKARGLETRHGIEELKEYAAQLQLNSTIGDESSLAIMRNAIAMGASTRQAKSLTQAAADMSAALGRDFESSAAQMLKTLGGFAGELGEVMPELKGLTKEQLQAGAAIDLIGKKFAGFAQNEAGTMVGQLKQLTNAWGDLKEAMGQVAVVAAGNLLGAKGQSGKSAVQSSAEAIGGAASRLVEMLNAQGVLDSAGSDAGLRRKFLESQSGRGSKAVPAGLFGSSALPSILVDWIFKNQDSKGDAVIARQNQDLQKALLPLKLARDHQVRDRPGALAFGRELDAQGQAGRSGAIQRLLSGLDLPGMAQRGGDFIAGLRERGQTFKAQRAIEAARQRHDFREGQEIDVLQFRAGAGDQGGIAIQLVASNLG